MIAASLRSCAVPPETIQPLALPLAALLASRPLCSYQAFSIEPNFPVEPVEGLTRGASALLSPLFCFVDSFTIAASLMMRKSDYANRWKH